MNAQRLPSADRPPIVDPGYTPRSVTEAISALVQRGPTRRWWVGLAVAAGLTLLFLAAVGYLLVRGVGIWGINMPVAWGVAITNFVWWIGIGHAGTLISAILLLFRQQWRTSINRFAEAMTLFAVACAALFPLLHMGRPWLFYWMMPYPNTMGVWPQFHSALVWDFFAIFAYGTVSLLFWFIGLVPDLATLRDRARSRFARVGYGILAMGWRGSAQHWHNYESAYFLVAALATPLVVSVHTIVSLDFATTVVPGWHSTIFPPYFVAGALFSGLAMVLTIAIPLRAVYGLEGFITRRHLENLAKLMLAAGLVVGYSYLMEAFIAWYSGNAAEEYALLNRLSGPYAPWFWLLLVANVGLPQLLWLKRVRTHTVALFALSVVINVGMWLERFIIVVASLSRDYLPSAWGYYAPTLWDWATFAGSLGLFLLLMFLFVRYLPVISIFEMRELVAEGERREP
jgi:molybdopterin-containing oxidoreductase family membrane subunit